MDESVAVRRGEPADAEAIRGLVAAAYTKWIPEIGRLPIPMQADYRQAVRDHRFDLLLAGPDLAGLIETRAEADHLLVVNVAVHPAFQGRGFGSRLMGRADAVAAEAGLARLRLYTNKKYVANLRLYGALGYRVEREEPYGGPGRTRDDDVTVHMVKDLA
jgi:ribosomal protein S18 acetylase RimI-like enzyme